VSLVSLKAELRQTLKLTPQLMQSMELLQMNALELAEHLTQAAQENPLLEEGPPLPDPYEQLRGKAAWLGSGPQRATFRHEEGAWEPGRPDRETESLASFLRDQLERLRLPPPLMALCQYLAELTDEEGYLSREDLEELERIGVPPQLTGQALETMQGLEPAGVCARDLSECLCLQLNRLPDAPPAARAIAEGYLQELGRKHYGVICRELGLSMAEIQAAEAAITGLEPHPGRSFQTDEPAVYVLPDILIVELDGVLQAVLNEHALPQLSLSDYYVRMLKASPDTETQTYLKQKLQQAQWLLQGLERRSSTLKKCAEAILNTQRPFFSGQSEVLQPMGLAALASLLEVHPSTVSRALRGKHLQCRQGTYPLRYFLSREVGGGVSRQAVQRRLLALIRDEDPRRPLSDQALSQLLRQEGMPVARRTVAKYRAELRIGGISARRRR